MVDNNTTVLIPAEKIDIVPDVQIKKAAARYSMSDVSALLDETSKEIEKMGSVSKHVSVALKRDPDSVAKTFSDMKKAKIALDVKVSEVNEAAKDLIVDNGNEPIVSERYGVQWSVSKPKTEVDYDIEGLKSERPDIYKQVMKRNGKPMKKDDRNELDEKIEDLQAQLATLRKQQVADDVASDYAFNEELMDALVDSDESLSKFRSVRTESTRIYFKNIK